MWKNSWKLDSLDLLIIAVMLYVAFGSGGVGPEPDPTPGRRSVTVLYESKTLSAAHAQTLQALRTYSREKNHQWRERDKDVTDSAGHVPAWIQSLQQAIASKGLVLPVLAVGVPGEGDSVTHVKMMALPESPSDAIQFLQDCGG